VLHRLRRLCDGIGKELKNWVLPTFGLSVLRTEEDTDVRISMFLLGYRIQVAKILIHGGGLGVELLTFGCTVILEGPRAMRQNIARKRRN
jgi:hypothetical protein